MFDKISQATLALAKKYTDEHGGGGSGDGDMKTSVYDNDHAVKNAGGIKSFVTAEIADKQETLVIGEDGYINL